MAKKIISVSVISELSTDQRIIRICNTLQEMGFSVKVIARELKGSLPLDRYTFGAKRLKCFFRKGILQYVEFNLKLFVSLIFTKTDYFLANDLDTLLPNFLVSRLRFKKIFYDTHEYFTGVPELKQAHFKRKVWEKLEDWIFPRLPIVYTVNNSVKKKYQEKYNNKNFFVIRNVPASLPFLPQKLPESWEGKIILLMQGIGINPGRGGSELLEMMKYLPDVYYLVFIGGGLHWENLKKEIITAGLQRRVEMIPKVPPAVLRGYTSLAHWGFSLDQPIALNYELSLPNKIFDYIHAGIPVAATPVQEVKNIIEQYGFGFCFTSNQPQNMAIQLETIMSNTQQYEAYRRRAVDASKILCWENEKKRLIEIYRPFLQ